MKRTIETHTVHSVDDLRVVLDQLELNWKGTHGSEIGIDADVRLVQTTLTDKSVVYDIVIDQRTTYITKQV